MQNTEAGRQNPLNKANTVSQVFLLIDEILDLSKNCLQSAEQNKLEIFSDLVNRREQKISRFHQLRETLQNTDMQFSGSGEKDLLNQQINQKLEIIAKVDQKTLDIIKCKQDEIRVKAQQANQGLNFLKSYKKRVNDSQQIVRTI